MDQISIGSTAAGLAIGSLVVCANFQFGLQTGWVSMMSMPSALLGFAWFKVIKAALSPQENVYIQSVAIAVGTGPLSFGFVGAIPAIEKLLTPEEGQVHLGIFKLMAWSFAISFIGIFTSVLLRETIIRNKELTFPSGAAAAALIGVLHDKPLITTPSPEDDERLRELESPEPENPVSTGTGEGKRTYKDNIRVLVTTFSLSSLYTAVSHFWLPILRAIPILGTHAAKLMWTFEPSPAYIGQGIIMGLPTTASMMLGAILGWAILSPLSRAQGWAPGPVDDWQNGSQGWIMWISLAIMVADTGVNFILLIVSSVREISGDYRRGYMTLLESASQNSNEGSTVELEDHIVGDDAEDGPRPVLPRDTPGIEHPVSQFRVAIGGFIAAALGCIVIVKLLFPSMAISAVLLAVVVSPVLSLLGVRALGETDLNPVSSIAKITQLLFGLIVRSRPDSVLLNIIAGAITEAGAQQAGDLMQDYKTGNLLGALMTSQTIGMAIGTSWSIILCALVYALYTSVYEIPGGEFRIPTAFIWADCARLMTGKGLPPQAANFALAFGAIFIVLALAKKRWSHLRYARWIPSGVAVGIGMYNVPSFTLARFVGGVAGHLFSIRYPGPQEQVYLVILSSGLILGEGIMSVFSLIVNLIMYKS